MERSEASGVVHGLATAAQGNVLFTLTCTWFYPYFNVCTAVKNTKTVAENMQKFQKDRHYLQSVISETLDEILTHQTFSSLISSVQQAHDHKAAMKQAILG